MIGDLTWNSIDWLNVFKNLLKIGLSKKVGVVFISLLKGFENMRFFEVLLKIQEEIVPSLIIPLKFENWRETAFEILKYCILEGPINGISAEKIMEKFIKLNLELKNFQKDSFWHEILIFIMHLSLKYQTSSIGEQLSQTIQKFFQEITFVPQESDFEKKFLIRSWMDLDLQGQNSKKSLFRGLHNLGNSNFI
jgi:hypothetical protein